jgi:hypothetical protein
MKMNLDYRIEFLAVILFITGFFFGIIGTLWSGNTNWLILGMCISITGLIIAVVYDHNFKIKSQIQ